MTCAIVLAAGRSRRMGTPKLLLPFAGSTVIARVVDACLGVPVDATLVVIRPEDQQVRAALGDRPVVFAENPDATGVMLSSVRCGLRALPAAARTILVSPGDQPSLAPGLIRQMLAHHHSSGSGITVPVHAGRRGHPIIFAARFREEILRAFEGVGLRGLLEAHAAEVFEWPTADEAPCEDLDTPADYRDAVNRQQAGRDHSGA